MIEIRNLTKKFGDFTAVDHLDLTIETNEFMGLLGPNGAGKTTTISMMSTVLLPTEGEILVDGQPLNRKAAAVKRKLSVVTQEYSMRQDMTMNEVMEYQGRLYYMRKKEIKAKTAELFEFAGLSDFGHRTVRHLSGGMKRSTSSMIKNKDNSVTSSHTVVFRLIRRILRMMFSRFLRQPRSRPSRGWRFSAWCIAGRDGSRGLRLACSCAWDS